MPGVPGIDDITQIRKDFTSLQAQVERLTEQVGRASQTATRVAKEVADDDNDSDTTYLRHRKGDEVSRFFRGMVFASLEAMNAAATSVVTLTTEATARNLPKPNESVSDVARRLPGDITRSMADGVSDALDIPGRAARRFNDVYSDPTQAGRSTQRRVTRAARDTVKSATGAVSRGS
jgi:hypothetical protein